MDAERNGLREDIDYDSVSYRTRLIIALIRHGIQDTDTLSYILVPRFLGNTSWAISSRKRAAKEADDIKRSADPAVQSLLKHGFPENEYYKLPYSDNGNRVCCLSCMNSINTVPCVLCDTGSKEVVGLPKVRKNNKELPLPAPTTALPGTDRKIAVMRLRCERGLQIFHPDDPFQSAKRVGRESEDSRRESSDPVIAIQGWYNGIQPS